MIQSSQQIQNLVDDLLVMVKQEQDKICLDYREVDLIALVEEVVRDYEVIAAQKKSSSPPTFKPLA